MTETQFNPGPWKKDNYGQLRSSDGSTIDVWGLGISHTARYPNAVANAALIASAPDMYAALEAAIECGLVPKSSAHEGGAMRHVRQVEVADMIRAALSKARGES